MHKGGGLPRGYALLPIQLYLTSTRKRYEGTSQGQTRNEGKSDLQE